MTEAEIQEQIKAIEAVTARALKSKKFAFQILKNIGLIDKKEKNWRTWNNSGTKKRKR